MNFKHMLQATGGRKKGNFGASPGFLAGRRSGWLRQGRRRPMADQLRELLDGGFIER
jgi:hypothetical protein